MSALVFHYFHNDHILDGLVNGTPHAALCGETFAPEMVPASERSGGGSLAICEECRAARESLRSEQMATTGGAR